MSLQQPKNPLYTRSRIDDDRLPDGWWIERLDRADSINPEQRSMTTLFIFEADTPLGEDGEPTKVAASIEIFWVVPGHMFGLREETEISWPSKSDKRPVMAKALGQTLVIAAELVAAEEVSA